jgi:hypothetical protein
MLKKEVRRGAYYAIRHSGETKLCVIQIGRENPYGGWDATKLKTGRTIRIRSAAKLRFEVVPNPDPSGAKFIKA